MLDLQYPKFDVVSQGGRMPFYKLDEGEIAAFHNYPEISGGLQIGIMWNQGERPEDRSEIVFVYGGRVAFEPRSDPDNDLSDYLKADWLRPSVELDERTRRFEAWLNRKAKRPGKSFAPIPPPYRSLIPLPSPATMPPAPPVIYGHLPYLTTTQVDDVFYHFEPFPPPSGRVYLDPVNGWQIAAGTFANPKSELPMMVSGFAVTARNALPGLLPACFRYELQPVPKQPIRLGAGVPLFGHAGGGVEIEFAARTANRGPVANPVFLDPF